MTVTAVVQARLASERLPGKVLYPAPDGRPLIAILLHRLSACRRVDDYYLAVPHEDRVLQVWSEQLTPHHACAMGSETDVLSRYAAAIAGTSTRYVVRVTGDCPLVCPAELDRLVWTAQAKGYVYLRTGDTYPEGLDAEVFTRAALEEADTHATSDFDREHVTPWIRRTYGDATLELPEHLGHIRVTIDTSEDYAVVYQVLSDLGPDCTLEDIVTYAREHPDVMALNAATPRNEWMKDGDSGRNEVAA
jgi:spore coat polysaccharide biosynthesis protein SpsF (cytidylyltransferase family)